MYNYCPTQKRLDLVQKYDTKVYICLKEHYNGLQLIQNVCYTTATSTARWLSDYQEWIWYMRLRQTIASHCWLAIYRMIKMLHRVKGRDMSKLRYFVMQFTVQSIVRFDLQINTFLEYMRLFDKLIFFRKRLFLL